MMTNSPSSANRWLVAAAGLAALAVYLLTLAPTVLFADGGEFQFVPWLPGLAHPTGYPLYTLAGWLFSHLIPLGEPAWRLNLFSAVTGAVAVSVVCALGLALADGIAPDAPRPARQICALGAALIFAFGRTFWSQALIAEVYSLHALLVALTLWAAWQFLPPTEASRQTPLSFKAAWPPALLIGLGLAHHRTIVLLIPALALYLWLAGYKRLGWANGLKLLAVGAAPALLYLYLPLIAPHTPYLHLNLGPGQTLILYHNTLTGFIDHLTARVFSAEVKPAAIGLDRLLLSLDFLRQQVGWAGGLLGMAGLFSQRRHLPALALTLGAFAGFWAFNLVYFIGDIYVLFIPCWLILSLWMGLGGLKIAQFVSAAVVRQKRARLADSPIFTEAARKLETRLGRLLTIGGAGLLWLFVPVLLITRWPAVDQSRNTIARDAWVELLGAADFPADAVLVSNDRNEIMPMWYYQWVEGRRLDLLGLFPLITAEPEFANVGRVLDQALASGRPVYLIKPMPGLEIKADLLPLPPLPHAQPVRVMSVQSRPEQSAGLVFGDELRLAGYDEPEQTDHALTMTLYWQIGSARPAQNYTTYIHLLAADGSGLAQSDHRPGGEFYPSTLWQPGETLRDTHTLILPADLPPGPYQVAAGVYFQPEPGRIETLGRPEILSTVTIGE